MKHHNKVSQKKNEIRRRHLNATHQSPTEESDLHVQSSLEDYKAVEMKETIVAIVYMST